MSDPRDVIDDKFDEPSEVPAMPSRPADEHPAGTRIRGVAADDWALGIERKLDAVAKAQIEALQESAESNRVMANEVRAGFAKVLELLKTQEQHAREIRELRTDTNANTRRIDEHADQLAAHRTEIEKLKKSANARLKGKR